MQPIAHPPAGPQDSATWASIVGMLMSFGYSFLCLGMSIYQLATGESRFGQGALLLLSLFSCSASALGMSIDQLATGECLQGMLHCSALRLQRHFCTATSCRCGPASTHASVHTACAGPAAELPTNWLPAASLAWSADGVQDTSVGGYPVNRTGSAQKTFDIFNVSVRGTASDSACGVVTR